MRGVSAPVGSCRCVKSQHGTRHFAVISAPSDLTQLAPFRNSGDITMRPAPLQPILLREIA